MSDEPRRRISRRPRGEDALRDAAALQRTLNRLRGGALVPKGIFRFARHEEADEWMTRQIASTHVRLSSEAIAEGAAERMIVEGVPIAVAGKEMLIRTKQTVRPSDAADVGFLRALLEEEKRRLR